jgi:hypothetical protein
MRHEALDVLTRSQEGGAAIDALHRLLDVERSWFWRWRIRKAIRGQAGSSRT